jgi:hypothetical protein
LIDAPPSSSGHKHYQEAGNDGHVLHKVIELVRYLVSRKGPVPVSKECCDEREHGEAERGPTRFHPEYESDRTQDLNHGSNEGKWVSSRQPKTVCEIRRKPIDICDLAPPANEEHHSQPNAAYEQENVIPPNGDSVKEITRGRRAVGNI